MGRTLFITATDTGAGKSFVTANLIRLLRERGISASAIKPVASGVTADGINEDVALLLASQNLSDVDKVNLYSFSLPASPNIAAQAEERFIEPEKLVAWCNQQAAEVDLCLIEGVGGLMVPLNDIYRVSDWITEMQGCEVMLIVGARLGCINHTLLTLEQFKQIGVTPAYIVINALDDSDIAEQTTRSLQPWLPAETTLFQLPFAAQESAFLPVTEAILANA